MYEYRSNPYFPRKSTTKYSRSPFCASLRGRYFSRRCKITVYMVQFKSIRV